MALRRSPLKMVAVKDCHLMLPWWKPVVEMALRQACSTMNPTTEGLFLKVRRD